MLFTGSLLDFGSNMIDGTNLKLGKEGSGNKNRGGLQKAEGKVEGADE